jgi:hypothetical protein
MATLRGFSEGRGDPSALRKLAACCRHQEDPLMGHEMSPAKVKAGVDAISPSIVDIGRELRERGG